MIPRPQADEYNEFYGGYIDSVPEGADLFALMRQQPDELRAVLSGVTDEQANVRPAPGEWSIKEVLGHICDGERIFAYRALRIGRGDSTPLAGFDQDAYVQSTDFNARSLDDLLEEFTLQRRANLVCFKHFTEAETLCRGTASGQPVSARALLYILVGHVIHHMDSLKTTYKVGAKL
jgi:uncharacterized damage-inducible protein DinB